MKFNRAGWQGIFLGSSVAALLFLVFGCGGGGSDSGTGTAPVGNAAVRSTSVSSYQSLGSGIAFPFASLAASAPSGSTVHGLALLSGQYRKYLVKPASGGLSLVSQLGLYTDGGVMSGGTDTFHYYTDSAGKDPAGTMTITSQSGAFTYTSYPVTIDLAVNVTGGNIPCNGSCAIVYAGPTGTNTLKGTLNLTKNNEVATVDLALSSSLDVSGTITIKESNSTITATNVSGPITGDLTLDFTLQPQGFTGIGTINLSTNAISLVFTNPSGASTSLSSSGDLVIKYADGTSETVTDPFTATLLVTGGTTGSTTATTTTGGTTSTSATTGSTSTAGTTGTTGTTGTPSILYNAPTLTNLNSYVLSGFSSSDGMVVYPTAVGTPYYYSSPTAVPQALSLVGAPYDGAIPNSVNRNGVIVGQEGAQINNDELPIYWGSPTAAFKQLKMPSGYTIGYASSINDNGAIVGSIEGASGFVPAYWSSTSATASILSTKGQTGIQFASAINNNGQILTTGEQTPNCVWSSSTANPVVPTCAAGYLGSLRAISNFGIGGFEYKGSTMIDAVWPSPGFVAKPLGTITGYTPELVDTINDTGVAAGSLAQSDNTIAVLWDTKGNAELISQAIPAASQGKDYYYEVLHVFNDNSCLVAGGKGTYYITAQ